jgi:hypothetical protein
MGREVLLQKLNIMFLPKVCAPASARHMAKHGSSSWSTGGHFGRVRARARAGTPVVSTSGQERVLVCVSVCVCVCVCL